jgi:hypothetical protein
MEKHHNIYKEANTRKWFAKEKLDYKMNIGFWRHPLKYLTNKKGEKYFDFETSGTVNEKQISISHKNHKWTLTVDGESFPPSKSLPKLLNTKKKGQFVFEGLEGGIAEMINKEEAKQLRKNRKVESKIFAAKDPITERVYFMED